MKRVIIFLFTSCEGVFNNQDTSELDNKADQEKIDKLFTDITKENYANRVSDISGIYGKRFKTVGLRSENIRRTLEKGYQVQPKDVEVKSDIRKDLKEFNARTRQKSAKNKDVSAFDVLLKSEQADTGFTDIENVFCRRPKIFLRPRIKNLRQLWVYRSR